MRRHTRSRLTVALAAAVSLLVPAGLAHADPASGPAAEAGGPIVHQVPDVPTTIDGESVDPSSITEYNGRPLYMAALPGGSSKGRLAVFTDGAEFERFVSARGGPADLLGREPQEVTVEQAAAFAAADDPSALQELVTIHEHAGPGGAALGIPVGTGVTNLQDWDLSCFLFFCNNWNDETSAATAGGFSGMSLFEHRDFGRSVLWVNGGTSFPDLTVYGWNDRTSSFASF
ncbi:hypothetical protein [Streptomyces sp. SBT349]|uniref:hypothetical protein n=1 Tax=Streptomyces sp. SBT349 TaxID=1580539 RepID=UPI00066B80CD|nr:hypothetical protein [Streptomyces sp. SBT349]